MSFRIKKSHDLLKPPKADAKDNNTTTLESLFAPLSNKNSKTGSNQGYNTLPKSKNTPGFSVKTTQSAHVDCM